MSTIMLEKIDLTKKIEKSEYKKLISEYQIKLGELQRKARSLNIPIIIVFEGWDAAGKGTMINQLLLALDPRGFTVYPTNPPTDEEKLRPFLWRFWIKTPESSRIAIFDRSWYGKVLVERVDKIVKKKEWEGAYQDINTFEKQLVSDGTIIIKFFLHIDKQEQKKRFKKLESNPATAWKVTKSDWKHHKQYNEYVEAVEEMLYKTSTALAPWAIVESHDRRFATIKVFRTVMDSIEHKIEILDNKSYVYSTNTHLLEKSSTTFLDKVDLNKSLPREEYNKLLKKYQKRMMELEHEIFVKRIPVIIVYQGWDAAGKGGNIKRLVQGMDPRGYEVVTIGAPNDIEKKHHYLWRFWNEIPKAGHITIFDRSWYGRVVVERVEGFCTEEEWKRAYSEINEIEEQLSNFGTIIIKFWLHIDKDEQLRRFEARKEIAHKQWKITDEDWRNREQWDLYKAAVDEMLRRTSTSFAPWTIIEANDKLYARIKTIRTIIESIEAQL